MKWIFEKERKTDDESALFALSAALDTLRSHFTLTQTRTLTQIQAKGPDARKETDGHAPTTTVAMSMFERLSDELRKLKCEFTVKQFCSLVQCTMQSVMRYVDVSTYPAEEEEAALLGQLDSPGTLLRMIFEMSVNVCWNKQMGALFATQGSGNTRIFSYC